MELKSQIIQKIRVRQKLLEDKELYLLWELAQRDPLIFLDNFVWTYDPLYNFSSNDIAERPFTIKPYIPILVDLWQNERLLLVAKSRKMCISWLFIALYVWEAIVQKRRYTFFQSVNETDAGSFKIDSLLARAKFIIDGLDERIRPFYEESQTPPTIRFKETDSIIHAVSQESTALRQKTPSGILADELAFQEYGAGAFGAVRPALGSTGKYTGISTPNGKEFFYRLYADEE